MGIWREEAAPALRDENHHHGYEPLKLTGMILQIDLWDERKLRVFSFLTRKSVQSNSKVEATISSKLTFHLHVSLRTNMRRALFISLIFMT